MRAVRSSLASRLIRQLALIAAVVVALNLAVIGTYYGSDQRALEAEMVEAEVGRIEAALEGRALGPAARDLYAEHPRAYAYALVNRGGVVVDAMNRQLIPTSAIDIYADDWVTRLETPGGRMLVAGHEFEERQDGLRVVFVMISDPANLLWQAFFSEFFEHVWLPILPMALLLIGASAVSIRRGLAPVALAAAWARGLRPGPVPPPLQSRG